jgi:hypothetical protein
MTLPKKIVFSEAGGTSRTTGPSVEFRLDNAVN